MANKIKQIREARKITQEELAGRAGTSPQQISRLENGERRLSDYWLDKLAPALNVRRTSLLGESDDDRGGNPAPSAPEFVDDPDELAWLRFWREVAPSVRPVLIAAILAAKPDDDTGMIAPPAST